MGHVVLKLLGVVLAIWVVFMAVGWFLAMLKTFLIIGLIAAGVFFAVSMVTRRRRT